MVDTSFQQFARKALKKKMTGWAIDIALLPVAIPLLIVRYVFRIKFFRIHGSRFGHLAMHNEVFLRREQLGLLKKKRVKYIGLAPSSVCNQRLLDMFKRKLTIIQFPQPRLIRTITKIMSEKSILSKWDIFVVLPYDVGYFPEYNQAKPSIVFTYSDEKEGKELLNRMGILDNKWYICFHARDSAYVGSLLKRGDSRYIYRNSTIENFFSAVDYITKQNGYAVRMGSKVGEKLPEWNNPYIIDYSSSYRTELGDMYVPAKCKFLIGTGSGIESIASIFNIPTIRTNMVPLSPLIPHFKLNHFPPGKHDLFIPKKIWSKEKKRFLTFKEEIEFDTHFSFDGVEYEKAGLVPMENTPKELLALTIEMNQRLDGTWVGTKEDEELQRRFKSLFVHEGKRYEFSARIGAVFLRENKPLLE